MLPVLRLKPHTTMKWPWYSGFLQKHFWPTGRKQQYFTGVEHSSHTNTTAFTSTMATCPCSRWLWISWIVTELHQRNLKLGTNGPWDRKRVKCGKALPFLYYDSFAISLQKEVIYPVLFSVKMLLVERLTKGNKEKGKTKHMFLKCLSKK